MLARSLDEAPPRRASFALAAPTAALRWEPSAPCPPARGFIDLWLLELGHAVEDAEGYATAWLGRLVTASQGDPPAKPRLARGLGGKPALDGSAPFFFNWSRSGGAALCAIGSGGALGVDIERSPLRPAITWERIARQRFAAGDYHALSDLPDSRARADFLRLWTRHEAILKASGLGLAGRVREPLGFQASSGRARCGGTIWNWRDVDLPEGCAAHAALAFSTPDGNRQCG